jgi:putative ABC transport system ATP-binding protein
MRIELHGVWKAYGEGEGQFWAIQDAHLEVESGDFLAIVGPSGSGKSTLLHLLGCLDTPTRGEVLIDGEPAAQKGDRELSLVRRNRIGFIFQQYYLNESMTAWQNVLLPLELGKVKDRRQKAAEALNWVGLGKKLASYPSELSGGEGQRVAIARALANSPEIVLADEPTGNLDSATGGNVLATLESLNRERGIGLVIVTHDAKAAACGKARIEVRDGRIS